MRYLNEEEKREAEKNFEAAIELAKRSTCQRSQCGSVIVKDGEVIGRGFNSPPAHDEKQRRCNFSKETYHKKVTDKTCCVHAEQRAIIDALSKNEEKIVGSELYFIRLDSEGKPSFAGKPYCTICSKMALDVGIREFILWHEDGICSYDTGEYNKISFDYSEQTKI